MQEIIEVIQTLGFPIAACVFMAYENHTARESYYRNLADITNAHVEESKAFTDALNENTLALQRLTDCLQQNN